VSWLTEKWHSVRTAGSWRGLSTSDFWNEYDACIATTEQGRGGRGNSYETWTFGSLIQVSQSLEEAKEVVESVYGHLRWETVKPKDVTVVHNYFGPTTEFTDPVTLHVVRKLPRL
jgi:hypothetical protein